MSDGVSYRSPHWSFWLVAVLAVLWNSFGAYDYLMTQTQGAAYLEPYLTAAQIEGYVNMPVWAESGWAIAIWFSVLGSVLLLFRSKLAMPLFAVSLTGMLVSFFYQLVVMGELARSGIGAAILPGVIVAIGVFLLIFALRQASVGVLR